MRDLLSKLDNILTESAKANDQNVEESGLQYYTGVKKHGKEYMKKAAQAGREGASQEELGRLKDKYSKAEKNKKTKEDFELAYEDFQIGDEFGISFSEDFEISTVITDLAEDGIIIDLDETALEYLTQQGFTFEEGELVEEKQKGLDGKACWKGYRRMGTKMKGGKRVDNCVKVGEDAEVDEAEYQGRKVPLGKPMKGDVKKSKVYVKNPQGNVVKVNFGDKKMKIKKSNPKRRKSFRARHNCDNPGPRHKARYWSCRAW
jgi:hypothetical protein